MDDMAKLRTAIVNLNGKEFCSADFKHLELNNICTLLSKLVSLDELAMTGSKRPKGHTKSVKHYKEIAISPIRKQRVAKVQVKKEVSAWADVWPEFFTPPKFEGKIRRNYLDI